MMPVLLALSLVAAPHPVSAAPATVTARHSAVATTQSVTLRFRYRPQRSATFLASPAARNTGRIRIGPLTARVKDGDARSVVVHPNERFLYASNGSTSDVEQYRILHGKAVNRLKPFTAEAASHPGGISFHPNGRFMYVSCSHGVICQYRVGRSGRLIPLSPAGVSVSDNPFPLLFDRTGRFACVIADRADEEEAGRLVYVYRVHRNGTLAQLRKIRAGNIDVGITEIVIRGGKVIAIP